ncbi:hypothetical protein Tco_0862107 [Tanacetum coccineum]
MYLKDECRRLRQTIKCGLVNWFTVVGEIQDKAVSLQNARLNDVSYFGFNIVGLIVVLAFRVLIYLVRKFIWLTEVFRGLRYLMFLSRVMVAAQCFYNIEFAKKHGDYTYMRMLTLKRYIHAAGDAILELMNRVKTYFIKYWKATRLHMEQYKLKIFLVEKAVIFSLVCYMYYISSSIFYVFLAFSTGILQEMIGNADDADTKFLLGKSITSLLNLPMFAAAFSTHLGIDFFYFI